MGLRIERSKSLAAMAPGLVKLLCEAATRICSSTGQVKVLNIKEKQTIAAWQAHFGADHKPFRNDCAVCLGGCRDKQGRKVERTTAFCLTLDIAGPFQLGVDQIKSSSPRYFLAATISIPVTTEGPLVQGLKDLGFKVKPSQQPHRMAEMEQELEGDEQVGQENHDDPWQRLEGEEEMVEGEVELRDRAEQEQKMEGVHCGLYTGIQGAVVCCADPISQCSSLRHLIPAVANIFARIRSMQIPVVKVHTDRAKGFAAQPFREWRAARDLWHAMSAGDEPSQNSRVEHII